MRFRSWFRSPVQSHVRFASDYQDRAPIVSSERRCKSVRGADGLDDDKVS